MGFYSAVTIHLHSRCDTFDFVRTSEPKRSNSTGSKEITLGQDSSWFNPPGVDRKDGDAYQVAMSLG